MFPRPYTDGVMINSKILFFTFNYNLTNNNGKNQWHLYNNKNEILFDHLGTLIPGSKQKDEIFA